MTGYLTILAALPPLFLAACGNADAAAAERQEFQERMEDQIGQFQQRIEEARERSENMSGESREQLDKAIKDVEEQLDRMREATGEQWDAARGELEYTISELERAFNDFRQGSGTTSPPRDLVRKA